ncbi:MAG: hypothetical protein KA841_00450 [Chitinophagales bacterium]|nr:hypothetical protein [Chitinophagales bacterium]
MLNFNVVFNVVFLTLFVYHVFYFAVQYAIIKRLEFLFYSLFLLVQSIHYTIFVTAPIINSPSSGYAPIVFSAFELSFSFVELHFYFAFIIAYLNLTKSDGNAYKLFRNIKYFTICFAALLLLLNALYINTQIICGIVLIIGLPITFTVLYFLYRLYSTHATIVIWGTVLNIAGTIITFSIINYELITHTSLSFSKYIPIQIGLLLELFVLGYGLSLKTAETDKKLVAALQENQNLLETERGRFARDLHDGLGGLLSSVKFSFSHMKENIILTAQQGLSFEQSLHKLDSGIAELRRIAQNMMPENLQQFGLDIALKDFCITIQQGATCKIHYESFGMAEYRSESTTDIAVYRIAQELVNNALKHAAASQIIIQLQKNEKHLILTVEDNGKGFDTAILKTEKGSGWKSIESRVNLLKGTINIISTIKGTTINIEIPL